MVSPRREEVTRILQGWNSNSQAEVAKLDEPAVLRIELAHRMRREIFSEEYDHVGG